MLHSPLTDEAGRKGEREGGSGVEGGRMGGSAGLELLFYQLWTDARAKGHEALTLRG